jgi:DNA-binding CsgD family transcriptional regulator
MGDRIAVSKREPVVDPALEKPLLKLHRTMDVNSFWRATQQLLATAISNRVIGLTLQPSPVLPIVARWTRPVSRDFFAVEPLKSCAAGPARKKLVRLSDLFRNHRCFVRSFLYRHYLAAHKCAHGVILFFWKRRRLICGIAIMRTRRQGDFSPVEMRLLRQLYPQFQTALRRLGPLEREHSVRMDFEGFLSRLPMPTIILRWNLKPIYQNPAAREFCALWEKGPEEAKRTKATSPIPSEILNRCRVVKERWTNAQSQLRSGPRRELKEEEVHHPRVPHLRATIHLKQLSSCGVAQPHFLIECEDLRRQAAPRGGPTNSSLPHLVRLTRREQEVARLVCEGRSNQEIADDACLSLPMVKKHLHAIFRKLEVNSRSRLIALMR